jgi:hypothetical protein
VVSALPVVTWPLHVLAAIAEPSVASWPRQTVRGGIPIPEGLEGVDAFTELMHQILRHTWDE